MKPNEVSQSIAKLLLSYVAFLFIYAVFVQPNIDEMVKPSKQGIEQQNHEILVSGKKYNKSKVKSLEEYTKQGIQEYTKDSEKISTKQINSLRRALENEYKIKNNIQPVEIYYKNPADN